MSEFDSWLLRIADDEHERVQEFLGTSNGVDELFEVKGRGRKKRPRGVVVEAKEFLKRATDRLHALKLLR